MSELGKDYVENAWQKQHIFQRSTLFSKQFRALVNAFLRLSDRLPAHTSLLVKG